MSDPEDTTSAIHRTSWNRNGAARPRLVATQNGPDGRDCSFIRYVREFANADDWTRQTVPTSGRRFDVIDRLKLLQDDDINCRQDLLDWAEERFPSWYYHFAEQKG